MADYDRMINDALAPLNPADGSRISPVVFRLFDMIFADLLKAVEGNPIEHHLIVLGHMMEIAAGQTAPRIMITEAAAVALLHDIAPVEKITTQMVAKARQEDPPKADALELKRRENRILHMREGSAMAHRRMLELNDRSGKVVLDAEAINRIYEVISIHDNPSLNIPIPRMNWLAVAFREADRLWMITHEGILADLARKTKSPDDLEAYNEQLKSNVLRFKEERILYKGREQVEGPFCDEETFFRTNEGHVIYLRLCGEAHKRVKAGKRGAGKREFRNSSAEFEVRS